MLIQLESHTDFSQLLKTEKDDVQLLKGMEEVLTEQCLVSRVGEGEVNLNLFVFSFGTI